MSDTNSLRKRLSGRHSAVYILVAVAVGLFLIATYSMLVAAAVPDGYNESVRYDHVDDFEADTIEDWNTTSVATGIQVTDSPTEGSGDDHAIQFGTNDGSFDETEWGVDGNQVNWSSSNVTMYYQLYAQSSDSVSVGISDSDYNTDPVDTTRIEILNEQGDLIVREIDSSGTTSSIGSAAGAITMDAYTNHYVEINDSSYIRVYVWTPGDSPPTSPTVEGQLGTVYTATDGYPYGYGGTSAAYVDEIYIDGTFGELYDISGTVTDASGEELENVTIKLNGTEEATTNSNGKYSVTVNNGTYNVSAAKPGYVNKTQDVTVSGADETANFELFEKESRLDIQTRYFLEHGEHADYNVTLARTHPTSGNVYSDDVTTDDANLTVTSGNTSVVTVNETVYTVNATSDIQVNAKSYVKANYSYDGETYIAYQNVTVANATISHIEILPPAIRLVAALDGGTDGRGGFAANPNDRTLLVIIIATAAAAAVSIIATSLAGIGTLTAVMVAAWIIGATPTGMMLVSVFMGIFTGLNVAGNVDYQIQR